MAVLKERAKSRGAEKAPRISTVKARQAQVNMLKSFITKRGAEEDEVKGSRNYRNEPAMG